MTALDQAFIKAYKQQGRASESVPMDPGPSAPGPKNDSDKIETQIALTVAKLNDVMAALEKPSGKLCDTPTASDDPAVSVEGRPSGKTEARAQAFVSLPAAQAPEVKPARKRKKKTPPPPTLEELDVPEVLYRLDPPCPTIPEAPRAASFTSPPPHERPLPDDSSDLPPYNADDSASADTSMQSDDANPPDTQKTRRFDPPAMDAMPTPPADSQAKGYYPDSAIRVFQPMLQVDHFAWPKVCQRIESVAALELDRLADTLLAAGKQGMKVVGLSGAERGEGATTMLLCAARRLVSRNAKIVLIDADLSDPQIAKRLGLLPQLGWEDVAAGRQPVEEVLVESVTDKLAVLPLCGPLVISQISYASQRIMAESLNTLRKNYDLVLMDLGPLENPQSLGNLTSGGLNCRIDAVTVVHKVGKILATCLPAVRQSLASAGVAVAGVIENFVLSASEPKP